MVVNYNADILSIALLLVYMLPRLLEFTIPMSVMISILLTFMRMSQENEIIALKGAGLSLYKLLPPVLIFCFLGVLMTMWVTVFGVSWGKLSLKKKSIEIASSSLDVVLQERQFNSKLEDVMIYVSHVNMKAKTLKDVFIEDRRTKGIVSISVSPFGELIHIKDENVYTIRLYNGMINQVDIEKGSVNTIKFSNYDINIDFTNIDKKTGKISKDLDEISLFDLIKFIQSGTRDKKQLNAAMLDLHEKLSIPFACLTLGILAFPLGIQSMSLRQSSGFGLGISFFLFYYSLLAVGWSIGESGNLSPVIGMWLPNVIMGGAGVFFLVRNAKENPVRLPGAIQKLIFLIKIKLTKKA